MILAGEETTARSRTARMGAVVTGHASTKARRQDSAAISSASAKEVGQEKIAQSLLVVPNAWLHRRLVTKMDFSTFHLKRCKS